MLQPFVLQNCDDDITNLIIPAKNCPVDKQKNQKHKTKEEREKKISFKEYNRIDKNFGLKCEITNVCMNERVNICVRVTLCEMNNNEKHKRPNYKFRQ